MQTINGREYVTRDEAVARLQELDRQYPDQGFPAEARQEWNALGAFVDEVTKRQRTLQRLASDPSHWDVPRGRDGQPVDDRVPDRSRYTSPPLLGQPERSGGLRAIERFVNAGELRSEAADVLDRVVRHPSDKTAIGARYLAAVGNPDYYSAFGKMVTDPTTGHLPFTPAEVEAVRVVSAVEEERALGTTTGPTGAFAIPFTLDPSVMLSSNGALNPIRDLARVFTIATKEWKGVSSDGVTAVYVAEAAEATDASPTLAQPAITTVQGRAFVPFAIELGQDWAGLQDELLRLIADARDVLDATQFLTGTGPTNNQQVGLLNIGGAGSLTTAQRVQTDVAATLDIDDVWDLEGNLGNTRFFANARFAANPGMLDRIYRFTPAGSTTEPQAMPTREGPLCGKPTAEWSPMVNTTSTASRVLIVGDFSNYLVADRLGMTAELIPHLFGATNRFPTGQRGIHAYWRTGSVVAVPNGFRYLEVA